MGNQLGECLLPALGSAALPAGFSEVARELPASSPRAARCHFHGLGKGARKEPARSPILARSPFAPFFVCRVFFARKRPAAQPANFHFVQRPANQSCIFCGFQIKTNALYFVDPLPHHSPFVVCGRYVRGFIGLPFCRPRVAQCRFRGFTRSHISKCHVCWDRVQFCHESIANVDGGMGVGRTSWHSNTYGISCIPVAIP